MPLAGGCFWCWLQLQILIAVFGAQIWAAPCVQPAPGIVGWWPAEGNANDLIGTNNGVLRAGATANATGLVGTAFSFDGTNSFVQFPDAPAFHPSNLTVEAWVKFTALDSAGSGNSPAGEQYIIFKQNTRSGTFEGLDLGKERVGGSDYFRFLVSSAAGQAVEVRSSTVVATGIWYHVAGVRGSNFTRIYVNGQLERQTNVTFPQDYGTLPFYFGTSGQPAWDHKFKGTLDEAALYNRALASNEIAGIYAAGAAGKCGSPASPPAITLDPVSRTNVAGTTATFMGDAVGGPPLKYQWLMNGLALTNGAGIGGANSNQLVLTAVQPSAAGAYALSVSNSAGMVTSAVATLTVLVPPGITTQPQNVTVLAGSNATLNVSATGTGPLMYRWQHDGTFLSDGGAISGSATPTLSLSGAQTNDAGNYAVVITNSAGSITSAAATVTVLLSPVPPTITMQPANQTVAPGSDAIFNVAVSGTLPFAYQWQRNGAPVSDDAHISGAGTSALTLHNLTPPDAAGYRVVITNTAGGATSRVATLTVSQPVFSEADAVVLVNSASARYSDFQRLIQPYLETFGIPYSVHDIVTNPVGAELGNHALIIVGHRQLDTNHTFLNAASQRFISTAVSNGTGLVNFDTDMAAGTTPRYQFVQDIFGFSYGFPGSGTSISFPPTQPPGQMHFITARHPTNDTLNLRAAMSLPGLVLPTNDTAVVVSGGKPLVSISKYGKGRAVQWGSLDWMVTPVLGPLAGLDDVVWRGMVWAGRKPFVMRGMPNFVTFRVDDVAGPFWWVHIADEVGFKTYVTVFISDVAAANIPDLRSLVTNGIATCSPHAFSGNYLIYWDRNLEKPYPDNILSNNLYIARQWHLTNSLPMSKVIATHYSEIGTNAFAGLAAWGAEYCPIEVVPGTIEYNPPYAPWLIGGPYRLYETPNLGKAVLPLYYADFLTVPGHPELDGKFFNCYTEMRDAASCGQWCPNNSVASSADQAVQIIKRGLDSQVLSTLFSHEFIWQGTPSNPNNNPITMNNWRAIMQGITNGLKAYNPIYVTLDYGNQYARATRTSRISSSQFDPSAGQVSVTLTGGTDLPISVQVFLGEDNSISNMFATVPAFTNSTTITAVTMQVPPVINSGPQSRTNDAGTSAGFSVQAAGTEPLIYRWLRNGTNLLVDSGNYSGSATATLMISEVLGADTGAFSVVVSNSSGAVTSATPAMLKVIDPVITSQPSSRINHEGTAAQFSGGAVGTTPAYQWLKDGVPVNQGTGSDLVFPSVQASNAGLYNLIVSNLYGIAPSVTASLSVVGPLVIQGISLDHGVVSVTWNAIAGTNYELQYNDEPGGLGWTNVSTVKAMGPSATATNALDGTTQGFYRVFLPP